MSKLKLFAILFFTCLIGYANAQQKKTTKKVAVKTKTSTPAKTPANPPAKPAEKPTSASNSTPQSTNTEPAKSGSASQKSFSTVGKNGNCFRKGNNVADLSIGFSGWGIPIAVQGEHFFTDDISGGVILSYSRYSPGFSGDAAWNFIYGGPRANYHFNRLITNFPDNMDLYGGLSLGYWHGWISGVETYGFNYGGTVYISLNAGGRYYFSDRFGVMAELGGGNITAIRAGLSLKL